jgi:hypothetical protein
MTLSENALKLTGVHLYFENFSKVYRHKYRRQCADFCLKNALKLTGVHLYFENFSNQEEGNFSVAVNRKTTSISDLSVDVGTCSAKYFVRIGSTKLNF